MDRRHFLKRAAAGAALYGAGGLPGVLSTANAQNSFAGVSNPFLVNVNLKGGPDWRHVLPPAWNETPGTYGYEFWMIRARAYQIEETAQAINTFWNENFYHRTSGDHEFGIIKGCEWLRDMWDANNVAIVANVLSTPSRDHNHAQLVLNHGNRFSGPNDHGHSGWGGRLASLLGSNTIDVSTSPAEFGNGLHPSGDPTEYYVGNLIAARELRKMSLYNTEDRVQHANWDERGNVTRALRTYYEALRTELDADSPYARLLDHEYVVREFGDLLADRLAEVPIPAQLDMLRDTGSEAQLLNRGFALQLRNLYDTLACADFLNTRVVAMSYGGWDSHDEQTDVIMPRATDLFGTDRGMDSLWQVTPESTRDELVFLFAGEFGRQLIANGTNGTDHGRGTSYIVVGESVNGGIYGDPYPDSELAKLDTVSPDIDGLTELDHVLGELCDHISPGSGSTVFPTRASAMLESGLDLSAMFTGQS